MEFQHLRLTGDFRHPDIDTARIRDYLILMTATNTTKCTAAMLMDALTEIGWRTAAAERDGDCKAIMQLSLEREAVAAAYRACR